MSTYQDLSLTLQAHPYTKDILKVTDVNAVKQSLKNIIFAGPYSFPFNPHGGANLRGLLFEQITPATLAVVKRNIMLAISELEPRAIIDDLYVGESNDDTVDIGILFQVIGNPNQQTFKLTLERVR